MGAAALLPALVLLVRCLAHPLPRTGASGDGAVAELYTLQACHLGQLLGPYSRNGFHHPGPAMFYALAPIYALGGHRHAALCLGALLINVACLGLLPFVLARAGRRGAAAWTSVAVAVYCVFLQPSLLLSVWNPYLSMTPFAVAVVAGVAAATVTTGFLPLALVAASFALQSHVAYALPLVAAMAVGLARAVGDRRTARAARLVRVHFVVAAALTAVMWLPPLLEQLAPGVGNVDRMMRFIGHAVPAHTWREAASETAWRMSAFLIVGSGGQDQLSAAGRNLASVLTVVQVVLLGWGARRAISRKDRFVAALCITGLALVPTAILTLRTLSDPFFDHLVRWTGAIGLVNVIAVAAAFSNLGQPPLVARATWPTRIESAMCMLLLVPIAALGVRQVARYPDLSWHVANAFWSGPEETLGPPVLAALARDHVSRPHVRIVTHASWPQAAGLVTSLTKAGVAVSVPERWTFMLGSEFTFHGDDGVLLVGSPAELAALAALPGVETVADAGGTRVLLAPALQRSVEPNLRFGDRQAELYLRDGFSYAERDAGGGFRWSEGGESLVSLPLMPGVAYRATLVALPIAVPGQIQVAAVELNGRRLGSVALTSPGWNTVTFDLPAQDVRTDNLLRFRYALVRSPAEVGGSGDTRQLAVAFRSLALAAIR